MFKVCSSFSALRDVCTPLYVPFFGAVIQPPILRDLSLLSLFFDIIRSTEGRVMDRDGRLHFLQDCGRQYAFGEGV